MSLFTRIALAVALLLVVAIGALYLLRPGALPVVEREAKDPTTEIIERGEYLARAGD
jgi:hypothetical protein